MVYLINNEKGSTKSKKHPKVKEKLSKTEYNAQHRPDYAKLSMQGRRMNRLKNSDKEYVRKKIDLEYLQKGKK